MKIGLGTVQFGMPYGVSNTTGIPGEDEVRRILDYAALQGIRMLDTAAAYGKSEKTLGRLLPSGAPFQVVTKTAPVKSDCVDDQAVASIGQKFELSLKNLHRDSVYGLLIHQAKDLLKQGGERLASWLMEQKASGKTAKVGVSVYDRRTLDVVLKSLAIDLVQLPMNILDQRLLADGYLSELKAAGIEVHVRSAFLQGLLLMDPEEMPPYFSGIKTHMSKLKNFMAEQELSSLEAAIGFISSIKEVDSVICGVNTLKQLEAIVACSETKVSTGLFAKFAITDEKIIDPSQWHLA